MDNRPEAATEQQIGIHVFGRPFGYNPNEDNIVRSQARLLRLKLEHHFAHEGLDEALIITIPKGQYLPVFTPRAAVPVPLPSGDVMRTVRPSHLLMTMTALAAIFATATILLTYFLLRSKPLAPAAATVRIPPFYLPPQTAHTTVGTAQPFAALAPDDGAIRIAAGTATDYVDARGHRWNSDRYFEGGLARPAPTDLFPPASDGGPFRSIREGVSTNAEASPTARNFRYVIPDSPGVYELRLYFADPNRRSAPGSAEDAQNLRHFSVNLNGVPILRGLDAVADASPAPVDVRAFKDVSPAKDGKVHLEFIGDPEPPFLSA
ncbi:MAG: hypothetical protein JO091_09635, partial [Acidobacteriaceae bacterium]|nr:hypothetical protein [Acidobacteriaceae bacterium]